MKIKNWQIVEGIGIVWVGNSSKLTIGIDQIISTGLDINRNPFDLVIHPCERSFITEDDIYALNTAVIYAIEFFNISMPKNTTFCNLIECQQQIIERKNNSVYTDEVVTGGGKQ